MTGHQDAAPRPFRPADAEAARALVNEALGATPYAARLFELLELARRADPESSALVAERDGAVAGLALFGSVAGARGVWKVHAVLLAPRASPRDVGRAMVESVTDRVRTLGGRMLFAELPADAAYGDTVSLLHACGFEQEGRIPDFYRDGVPLLFLRRDL